MGREGKLSRNGTGARPGQVDTAIGALDVIATAESYLAAHHDAVRSIATWLHDAPGLLEHLAGLEGVRGHSARLELQVRQRDALIRELGRAMPARSVSAALSRYASTSWPRDRSRPACPYGSGDHRATFWQILKLRDRVIGRRQIAAIMVAGK